MQQSHKETHFVIISNDTDLDHVVNLLKSQGRSAERMGNKKEEKETTQAVKTTAEATKNKTEAIVSISPIKMYCMHLITCSKHRPTKKDTLLNSIKSKFQDSPGAAAEAFRLLVTQGAVTVSANKVSYNDNKIKELANQA